MRPFTLSVVVPCFNEEDNIGPVYHEVVAELDRYDALEILFVDDGSTDTTLPTIRALAAVDRRVSFIALSRNFGIEPAFSAGYRYARHEWVLHLDADLQFPPAEAHRMIEAAQEHYDAVFGIRRDRRDGWLRRTSSRINDLLARRLLGIEIPAGATTFRLVRASLARRVVDLRLATPYFLATVPRLTDAWTTVPTAHRARARGAPKVRWWALAKHAVELYVSYSARSMTAAAVAGLLGALAACIGLLAIAADRPALGWLHVSAALGLCTLALNSRYLVHLGRAAQRTPLFLVREANVPIDPADLLDPRGAAVTTPMVHQ